MSTTTRRMTRDDIVRLGRTSTPWTFLPIAGQALRVAPQDPILHFLAASHFGRLGLPEVAFEHLDQLPPEVRASADVSAFVESLDPTLDARVSHETRRETLERNLASIDPERLVGPAPDLERWAEIDRAREYFRTADDNLVWRTDAGWACLGDLRGAASRFVTEHFSETPEYHLPIAIEGMDPPWLFRMIFATTPANNVGYETPIRILQSDPLEWLDGLAATDLSAELSAERVRFFIGPDATLRYEEWLRDRLDTQVRSVYIPLTSVRTSFPTPASAIHDRLVVLQEREFETTCDRVRARYEPRDAAMWAARLKEPGLRILIPTTLHSTYMRYASEDLVHALERLGHEARLLVEPEPASRLSALAYARAMDTFDPDLVIAINVVRSGAAGAIPDQVPYVCWLQDALGRLLDEEVGRAMHDLDFAVGMTFEALYAQYDYPRENALRIDTAASTSKFHQGPIDDDLREMFTCDVAYVGHQSETPDDQFLRFRNELSHAPELVRVVERVREVLQDRMTRPYPPSAKDVTELVESELIAVVGEVDPKTRQQLDSMCARPMVDRMLRHQSLEWVGELAEARGWTFHLHGRGWDRHPTLARWAKPPVEHGEALRACYACAGTHLHISANTYRHQRVYECFLSGGMALIRRSLADIVPIGATACAVMGEPDGENDFGPGYVVADHPEAMQYIALRQRYGLRAGMLIRPLLGAAMDPESAWLLVDPAEVTFSTRDELESRLERCFSNQAWRTNLSSGIRQRVHRHCTTESAVRRVLEFVQSRCQSYVP